jgi:hypothetical protein
MHGDSLFCGINIFLNQGRGGFFIPEANTDEAGCNAICPLASSITGGNMENFEEETWQGIEALRPVDKMTARLLSVPLYRPAGFLCSKDALMGGVHLSSENSAVVISGVSSDTVRPPVNNIRRALCCVFN